MPNVENINISQQIVNFELPSVIAFLGFLRLEGGGKASSSFGGEDLTKKIRRSENRSKPLTVSPSQGQLPVMMEIQLT